MHMTNDTKEYRAKGKALAHFHHEGIKDLNGVPYFMHPFRVGQAMSDFGYSEDAVVAGYLHDVVEDADVEGSRYTLATLIRIGFSARTVELVDGMSRRKDEGESYFDFIRRIKARGDEELIVLKLVDISDNTSPVRRTEHTDSMIKGRYARAVKMLAENVVLPELLEQIFPHGVPTK